MIIAIIVVRIFKTKIVKENDKNMMERITLLVMII